MAAKESTLSDDPHFVEIEVTRESHGISIGIDGQKFLVNLQDAQFLCDGLYVMLDEIRLEADDE